MYNVKKTKIYNLFLKNLRTFATTNSPEVELPHPDQQDKGIHKGCTECLGEGHLLLLKDLWIFLKILLQTLTFQYFL